MRATMKFASALNLPTALLILFACAIAMPGCGRSGDDSNANSAKSSQGTNDVPGKATDATSDFKVALVMSGPASDNGWNAGALKGLEAVKKELNLSEANVAHEESRTTTGQQDESLRGYASQKYNIIFAHGHEYQDLALKMESEFPKTLFVVSSADKVGKNTAPISLKLEDGAYLEGMLAAGMSKTHVLASVGAQKIPPLTSLFSAFEQGAKAVDPNVKVLAPAYTDSWDDASKAKSQTLALINQKADVIMQDVDAAAQGVFNAVSETAKSGKTVYALGTNRDQNEVAPEVVLASAPIYIEKAFVAIAKDVKAGTYKPTDKPFDLKSGVIGFVLNPKLADKIPADLKARIDAAEKKILDGTLVVPKA